MRRLLAPESGAFVITPICPHVLTNRSIIVDESAVIEIEVTEREYPVFLTVDGREPLRIEAGSTVAMRKRLGPDSVCNSGTNVVRLEVRSW